MVPAPHQSLNILSPRLCTQLNLTPQVTYVPHPSQRSHFYQHGPRTLLPKPSLVKQSPHVTSKASLFIRLPLLADYSTDSVFAMTAGCRASDTTRRALRPPPTLPRSAARRSCASPDARGDAKERPTHQTNAVRCVKILFCFTDNISIVHALQVLGQQKHAYNMSRGVKRETETETAAEAETEAETHT